MNMTVMIDWKFVAALGITTVGIIFAVKMIPLQRNEYRPMQLMLVRSMQLPRTEIAKLRLLRCVIFGLCAFSFIERYGGEAWK